MTWSEVMGVLNHFLNRLKKKEQLLHQKRHKNGNWVSVKVNLTLKHKHFRTHPEFTVPDTVKLYTKGAGNCISRNETVRLCETGHFPMLAWLNCLLNGSDLECGCTQCDWNLAVQIVALLPLLFLFFPLVFLLLNHLSLMWDAYAFLNMV